MAKRTPQLKVGEELILPALLHTVIAKMSLWNELGAGGDGGRRAGGGLIQLEGQCAIGCNVSAFERCGKMTILRSLELGEQLKSENH